MTSFAAYLRREVKGYQKERDEGNIGEAESSAKRLVSVTEREILTAEGAEEHRDIIVISSARCAVNLWPYPFANRSHPAGIVLAFSEQVTASISF